MFRLHGFFTQNSLKCLYVLEALGHDFEFIYTDLSTGVQKSDEFKAMNPVGKVPILDHDGRYLFESAAICRYAANVTGSDLYPADPYQRALVDQWMEFFTCHAGRWLTTLFFEQNIKPKFGLGDTDPDTVEEAKKFATGMLKVVDKQLAKSEWLANGRYSIADLYAFAYVEQESDIDYSIDAFPNLKAWLARIAGSETIANAKARLPQGVFA